jgi:hypothetical protein
MNKTSLQELYDELEKYDWFCEFSDDPEVFMRGYKHWRQIESRAFSIEGGRELINTFRSHKYSGKPWNTEQKPKPERPQ